MPEIRILQLNDITASADGDACCGVDGCCGDAIDPTSLDLGATVQEVALEPTATAVYGVAGMTCGHCVAAVTQELGAIPGVDAVRVDLVPGAVSTVTVDSRTPLGEDAVRAAIEEAGYSLV